MTVFAYIQGDLIKNPFLLHKINNKPIIEYTIENLLRVNDIESIRLCLYNTKENHALDYLKKKYPSLHIQYSKEQNAGKRMFETFKAIKPDIIIRVTGDQFLLDISGTKLMLDEFKTKTSDIHYHDLDDGLLPEVLSFEALEKCQLHIGKYHRFLKYITDNPDSLNIKKRDHMWQTPFFRFYIRNERELYIARQIIEEKLDYRRLNTYADLLFGDSGLYQDGWFQSFISKNSVNRYGEMVPWMTYATIDFLTKRIKKDMIIFEYGCGAGTIWWSKRVRKVTACEHNLAWVKAIGAKVPENVEIIHVDLSKGDSFAAQVEMTGEKYNVIVIDSRDRINCAKRAVKALADDGVIIWDDSQRTYDDEGKDFILAQGFKRLEFTGMSPIVKDKNETTIFYRDGNCLGI